MKVGGDWDQHGGHGNKEKVTDLRAQIGYICLMVTMEGERGRKRWLSNWTQKSTGQDTTRRASSWTKKE